MSGNWLLPMALASLLPAAYSQTAADVLAKVAETYANLTAGRFEGTRVGETKMMNTTSSQQIGFVVALAKPDKVKVEFDYGNAGVWVRAADGTTFTRYRSATKELSRSPASADDLRILDTTFLRRYERINEGVSDAKVAGSEKIRVGNADVDCHVIEVRYSASSLLPNTECLPTRFWIDKARFVVWREVSGTKSDAGRYTTENTVTTNFTAADVNGQVPPSLFAFEKLGK